MPSAKNLTTVPVKLTASQLAAVKRIAEAAEQPVEVVLRVIIAMSILGGGPK